MKKIIVFLFAMLFSTVVYSAESMKCDGISNGFKRCENDEVVCYVYDSGWAGIAKSGRGAGLSCKFKQTIHINVQNNLI